MFARRYGSIIPSASGSILVVPVLARNIQFLLQPLNKSRSVVYSNSIYTYTGFEVLTTVVIKSTVFWDITPFSLLKVNRRFRVTCLLHLQGRINRARNERE
jgi:hypothetical protein